MNQAKLSILFDVIFLVRHLKLITLRSERVNTAPCTIPILAQREKKSVLKMSQYSRIRVRISIRLEKFKISHIVPGLFHAILGFVLEHDVPVFSLGGSQI